MADVNVITVSGRIGRDAEVRETLAGQVVTFSLANGTYAKGEGEYNTRTTWYNITYFGDRAVKVADYLRKGGYVTVVGQHSIRAYTGKDGEEKQSNDIRATDVILSPKSQQSDTQEAPAKPAPKAAAPRKNAPQPIDDSENLPF